MEDNGRSNYWVGKRWRDVNEVRDIYDANIIKIDGRLK